MTSPTPATCASFCASTVDALSYSAEDGRRGEDRASAMMGACDGFTFTNVGLPVMPEGSCPRTALMAACTSRAASSMSRLRSNCRVTLVLPWLLLERMLVTPAMLPSERSSGAATVDAMLSGLAPGRLARTTMTGKSTRGSGATGSRRRASRPVSTMATASITQPTGRRMKKRASACMAFRRPLCARRGRVPAGRRPGRPPVW